MLAVQAAYLLIVFGVAYVAAYIPASPTNSSSEAIAGGLNVTDISKLYMQWFSNASYIENVSYQLVGFGSSGISKGALVHFSEEKVNNQTPSTSTPWIALVSCDSNATDASMEEDIFTLARDKGAVAALLYSLSSLACVINPEYADPATFDQVFDIFSTQSLTSAHIIEYQFGQLGVSNGSSGSNGSLYDYDAKKLNDSGAAINQSIELGYPVAPGYLYAVLQAYNANVTNDTTIHDNGSPSLKATKGSSPNTALAMIVLYAITGCVSALFCVVIISGAIRAIRHPERYGPRARAADGGMPGQSRARGLTRAILDTFPVVKFGTNSQGQNVSPAENRSKGVEANMEPDLELNNWECVDPKSISDDPSQRSTSSQSDVHTKMPQADPLPGPAANPQSEEVTEQNRFGDTQVPDLGEGSSRGARTENTAVAVREDVLPASIGRETCPICIVDFEEGDDLRVLPCEGRHCFHQQCVDPWLLELSSSCPICRHDFLALENMISGNSEDGDHHRHSMSSPTSHGNRFSRYLRFAARNRSRRRINENDPTDPYMPTAPDTSIYQTD